MPNSVLESYAYKKAVIASNLGSLNDLIVENETGLHFEAGNINELKRLIDFAAKNKEEMLRMGEKAYTDLKEGYSSDTHCDKLIEIFYNTIKKTDKSYHKPKVSN